MDLIIGTIDIQLFCDYYECRRIVFIATKIGLSINLRNMNNFNIITYLNEVLNWVFSSGFLTKTDVQMLLL
jgi:hypothetical protein